MALEEPREILDLQDQGSLRTRILRHELGTTRITPRDKTQEKEIEALRIYVPKEDKQHYPYCCNFGCMYTLKHVVQLKEK